MLSLDQLRIYPIFANLTEVELAGVPSILKRRAFARGAYIYYPGNPGMHSYLVESGLVRLFFGTSAGQELTLNIIEPKRAFGLPLLEDDQVRLLGAVAYQPSVLYVITREDMLRLMNCSSQFMCNIYNEVVSDSRRLLLHFRSLATLNLSGRLATLLIRLAKVDKENQYIVEMPLNQEELASWLGASRSRLNYVIHQFEEMNLIHLDGSSYVIRDYIGLKSITEEQTIEDP